MTKFIPKYSLSDEGLLMTFSKERLVENMVILDRQSKRELEEEKK